MIIDKEMRLTSTWEDGGVKVNVVLGRSALKLE